MAKKTVQLWVKRSREEGELWDRRGLYSGRKPTVLTAKNLKAIEKVLKKKVLKKHVLRSGAGCRIFVYLDDFIIIARNTLEEEDTRATEIKVRDHETTRNGPFCRQMRPI